jgi:isopentenyldiphosphate isomerase
MAEKLEIYDLKDNLIEIKDRDLFYNEIKDEFKKTGKVTKQLKRVLLLLMNSKGKIVLQRRNNTKKENPGLFDKTIGGHVDEGDSYELTIIKECSEELGFPVSILSKKDFNRALLKTDLRIIGLFREIDYQSNFYSKRISKEGDTFAQPYMQTVYIGYYDGPLQFIDGESSGIQLYTLEELELEIKEKPEKFTEDLKTLFDKYKEYIKPIQKQEK